MRDTKWNISNKEPKYITVELKEYQITDLEYELSKTLGMKSRTTLENVEMTYREAMYKHGTTHIKIRTNLVEPQVYKVGSEEIIIIN